MRFTNFNRTPKLVGGLLIHFYKIKLVYNVKNDRFINNKHNIHYPTLRKVVQALFLTRQS